MTMKIARSDIRPYIVGCPPCDCIWSLYSSSCVCECMYGLTYSLYHPWGLFPEGKNLNITWSISLIGTAHILAQICCYWKKYSCLKCSKLDNFPRKTEMHRKSRKCAIIIVIQSVPVHQLTLEALRERRPPWPRQIITPIFSSVIMLSLGCERLNLKVLDHYLHHNLGMLQLLCFFCFFYSG